MKDNDFLKPGDTVAHSNKQLMESPEIAKIAETVIERESLDFGPASIGYFLVYPNLSKYKAAKCKKASREVEYYSGHNYLIEISGEMWDMLDQKTREMVVFHQLLHVDPVYKAKNQEWKMKVRKPDFSDFYEINDKYGNDWYKTVQATVSSLYDLDPKRESKVNL
ncbi:putative metallopeptidase [Fodinibius sp. AD559]|jgi:hypothetical protein|uniref:putative metallopeptidase n=1 Tax=Fodinibius sp. AD559 TaxID=3424179 RepID=UPI0040469155